VRRTIRRKNCVREKARALTRREFTRHAATAAAAIAGLSGTIPLQGAVATRAAIIPNEDRLTTTSAVPQEASGGHPKLSAEAVAEAEARAAEILRRYGTKLTDEQKADIGRLAREAQAQLEPLRAFPLDNHDEPATAFRLVSASAARRQSLPSSGTARNPSGKGN
jgi:hypothetical protein